MPRIKLAYWHGEHSPGDEIEVGDDELAALQRDGRVAEVIQPPAEEPAAPQQEGEPQPDPTVEPAPDAGRKRR